MMALRQDTPGRCCKDRLQDEAKRKTLDALKDTSRTENESQTGYLVDQEDQDTLKDWVKSHRGGVMQEATVYG